MFRGHLECLKTFIYVGGEGGLNSGDSDNNSATLNSPPPLSFLFCFFLFLSFLLLLLALDLVHWIWLHWIWLHWIWLNWIWFIGLGCIWIWFLGFGSIGFASLDLVALHWIWLKKTFRRGPLNLKQPIINNITKLM